MRILIVGCGRMGAGLAQTLSRRGHAITVVDRDPAALERLGPAFGGATIAGVGFDRDVLLRAGVERADGIAAVTSSDEANIVVARLARQVFRVPRVVARLYDPRKAEIYRRLDIHTISTTAWGIDHIAELLCYSQLDALVSLGSGGVDIVQATVPPLLNGRSVGELTIPGEAHAIALERGGRMFLPTPGSELRAGDQVYLVTLAASVERLKALLGLA